MPESHEVTDLLAQARAGRREAIDQLFSLVYDDLRALAQRQLKLQSPGNTLQATALVNEAYLRLLGPNPGALNDREHFLALAARAMRCALIDHARGKNRDKRGGGWERVELEGIVTGAEAGGVDVLMLEEALAKLERLDPTRVRLVEYRFFGGLTLEEVSRVLGCSLSKVNSEWAATKVWLFRELSKDAPPDA